MIRLTPCFGWLAICLAAGCQTSGSKISAVPERLTPDSISALLPRSGTELSFDVTVVESSEGQTETKASKQFWKWQASGNALVLTKSDSAGSKVTEIYSTDWGICLEKVDDAPLVPCMPVIVDAKQQNPYGGFVGPRADGSVGPFSADHTYSGPESTSTCPAMSQSHMIEGQQTFIKDGSEVRIERTTWWSKGLGIVKQIETVTSKGLKRVTTLVLSPK